VNSKAIAIVNIITNTQNLEVKKRLLGYFSVLGGEKMTKKQKKILKKKLKDFIIAAMLIGFLIYSIIEIEKGIIIWLYA